MAALHRMEALRLPDNTFRLRSILQITRQHERKVGGVLINCRAFTVAPVLSLNNAIFAAFMLAVVVCRRGLIR